MTRSFKCRIVAVAGRNHRQPSCPASEACLISTEPLQSDSHSLSHFYHLFHRGRNAPPPQRQQC